MTGKVIVMDHPLITHKINYVRQENVGTKEFREVIGEIAQLMCYEATRDLKMSDVQIKTPIMEMTGKMLSGKKLAIVPILRAGIGMVDGMLSLIPAAKVGWLSTLSMKAMFVLTPFTVISESALMAFFLVSSKVLPKAVTLTKRLS